MIKRELTPEEAFNRWKGRQGIENKTFNDVLFDLLLKANLDNTEKIRTIYPEHVRVFEDYYGKN